MVPLAFARGKGAATTRTVTTTRRASGSASNCKAREPLAPPDPPEIVTALNPSAAQRWSR
jgi:Pyruvate/2-oxoacid:ferredoxin oxidoreductase gamma subunit